MKPAVLVLALDEEGVFGRSGGLCGDLRSYYAPRVLHRMGKALSAILVAANVFKSRKETDWFKLSGHDWIATGLKSVGDLGKATTDAVMSNEVLESAEIPPNASGRLPHSRCPHPAPRSTCECRISDQDWRPNSRLRGVL